MSLRQYWAFYSSLPSPCMAFFYSPRSIHLGDVSEANGRERSWQTRNAHVYVAFEIKDFVNSRKLWFFDRKTIKKTAKSISPLTADHSRRFLSAAVTQGISAFNFRWFQQPIRSCGIVLTVNQRCGQNLGAVSSSLEDLVSSPILAGLRI